MNVSTERLEKSQVALQVDVEPEMLAKSMDRAYRRLVAKANVPGFRRGKAPRAMLERYLGHGTLLQEALDILVPEAYTQAVQEQDIPAIGQPSIELTEVEPGVSFKATVAVQPTVELGDYTQLSFKLEPPDITEEQITETLQQLRAAYATWEPVEQPTRFDDMVSLDIDSTLIEDDNRTPYINQKDATYIVTAGRREPFPGFAEALEGQEKGTTRTFTLPLPEDETKSVESSVTVTEIKEKREPELDDEFAKTVNAEYETFATLRENVTKDLRVRAEREARNGLENEVIDALVGLSTLEYPDMLVEHEVEHLIEGDRSIVRDPQGRIDGYLDALGKTMEEFRAQYQEDAEKRVVRSLVLRQFAEKEALTVTPDEVDAEIENILKDAGDQQPLFRQWFDSPERKESLENSLMGRKTIDRLVDLATTGQPSEASGEQPASQPAEAPSEEQPKEAQPKKPRARSRSRS